MTCNIVKTKEIKDPFEVYMYITVLIVIHTSIRFKYVLSGQSKRNYAQNNFSFGNIRRVRHVLG